jgi:hypothetical protein
VNIVPSSWVLTIFQRRNLPIKMGKEFNLLLYRFENAPIFELPKGKSSSLLFDLSFVLCKKKKQKHLRLCLRESAGVYILQRRIVNLRMYIVSNLQTLANTLRILRHCNRRIFIFTPCWKRNSYKPANFSVDFIRVHFYATDTNNVCQRLTIHKSLDKFLVSHIPLFE